MIAWSVDVWDKYWPSDKRDRAFLETHIRNTLGTRLNDVQSVTFTDIPAQQDALGHRTVITIVSNRVEASIDHTYVALSLGLNP